MIEISRPDDELIEKTGIISWQICEASSPVRKHYKFS
jgi:hypothetical protein